jgi:hypothetical protein
MTLVAVRIHFHDNSAKPLNANAQQAQKMGSGRIKGLYLVIIFGFLHSNPF